MKKMRFRIVTQGDLLYGYEKSEVYDNLRRLCRYRPETMERLFSGETFVFKSDLDEQNARRYKAALDKAGIDCRVIASSSEETGVNPRPVPSDSPSKARAISSTGTVGCPKCGHRQSAGVICDGCGVVFSKYRQIRERQREAEILGVSAKELAETRARREVSGNKTETGFPDRLAGYFNCHQEQAFILKAFALIALILFVQSFLSGLIVLAFFLFPVVFLIYIRMQAAVTGEDPMDLLRQNITFIPVMYADGEKKKDGIAWITYLLILLNVVVFYGIEIRMDPQALLDNYLFLPAEPNAWNVPFSLFSSMFLHAGGGHLWGNMIFLWAVGTVVERRVGHAKFLTLYFSTGIAGGLLAAAVYHLFAGDTLHALGASGAIAGIMGVFAVRCYFKSMVFPLPILGIFSLVLPVSLKVRLNSLVIIGLFFLADLSGGIGQLSGAANSIVGHWIHIGGMLAGIGSAMLLRLGSEAIAERHLDIGAQAVQGDKVGLGTGEESLRLALRQNPDNTEAMLMLAQIQSKYRPTDEGRKLYRRAIANLVKTHPQAAAEAFRDYFHQYLEGVDPGIQFQLAGIYYRAGDLDMASKALEMLAADAGITPSLRERAILQYARVLEKLGLADAARNYYNLFVGTFPDSPMISTARARLENV